MFDGEAGGEACEGAVGAYDAVAGDEDGEAVGAYGLGYGSYALGVVDGEGDVFVGAGFAVGDVEECVPDVFLEVGADGEEGYGEGGAGVCEVFVELGAGLEDDGCGFVGEWFVDVACESAEVGLRAGVVVPVA